MIEAFFDLTFFDLMFFDLTMDRTKAERDLLVIHASISSLQFPAVEVVAVPP
jgi:hypothetical protein